MRKEDLVQKSTLCPVDHRFIPRVLKAGSFIPFPNFSMANITPYNREKHPSLDAGLLPPHCPCTGPGNAPHFP